MHQYKTLVQRIRQNGSFKRDRTGTGTLSVFGHEMRFDLAQGFPLVTLKSTFLPAIIHELLWFLSGSTNIKYLQDNNVRIWNEWADSEGNLGPVYGKQWRNWQATKEIICDPADVVTHEGGSKTYFNAKVKTEAVDQIAEVIHLLKTDPASRRIIVSAWNPGELHQMALMPCHAFFQFYVANGKLSCMITQRSADVFLGVPFNIASYALLTMMIAQQVGLGLGDLVWSGGDCHLYMNHLHQADELLKRLPKARPTMTINQAPSIFDYKFSDFTLTNYDPHPPITAKVAV